MTDDEQKRALAAQRSHEDAKAANALLQAAGQAAILINGGASTAILAFAASDKAGRIAPQSLAGALLCFAVGVVAGAFVIGLQAVSVQRYAVRWQNEVLGKRSRLQKAKKQGYIFGLSAQISFLVSTAYFMIGALNLSIAIQASASTCCQR